MDSGKAPSVLAWYLHTILFFILFPSVLPPPQPSAQDDLLAALLTCDVIVYDIVEDQTQVEEASWAVQGEGGEREDRKKEEGERREGEILQSQALHSTSLVSRQRLFLCIHTSGPDEHFQAMETWMGWRLDLVYTRLLAVSV